MACQPLSASRQRYEDDRHRCRAAGHNLGDAVGTSRDGATIVAGAIGVNKGQGAAIVVGQTEPCSSSPSPRGLVSQTNVATLAASDGTPSDDFGNPVTLSADGDTLAATSPPAGAYNQGAAYTFVKPATGWSTGSQTAKLTR